MKKEREREDGQDKIEREKDRMARYSTNGATYKEGKA